MRGFDVHDSQVIAKNICPSTIPTKSTIFVSEFEGILQSLYGCIKTNRFDMQNFQGDNRKMFLYNNPTKLPRFVSRFIKCFKNIYDMAQIRKEIKTAPCRMVGALLAISPTPLEKTAFSNSSAYSKQDSNIVKYFK